MARTEVRSAQIRDAAGVDLTVDVFGALPTANGGTGVTTPGASGNVLTSDGTKWVSQPPTGGGGGGNVSAIYDGGNATTTYTGVAKIDFGSAT